MTALIIPFPSPVRNYALGDLVLVDADRYATFVCGVPCNGEPMVRVRIEGEPGDLIVRISRVQHAPAQHGGNAA